MSSPTHVVLVVCALMVLGSSIYLLGPVLWPRRIALDLRAAPRPRMRRWRPPPAIAPEIPMRVSMRDTVIAPAVPTRDAVPCLEPPRFAREGDVDDAAPTVPEAYASYEVTPRRRR